MNGNVRRAIENLYVAMLNDDSISINEKLDEWHIRGMLNNSTDKDIFYRAVKDFLRAEYIDKIKNSWNYELEKQRRGEGND